MSEKRCDISTAAVISQIAVKCDPSAMGNRYQISTASKEKTLCECIKSAASKPSRTRHQYVIGLVVNLSTIAAGMILGFSAVALPPMQLDEHRPRVSQLQASWIASIASIAIPVGCLTIGGLLDRVGRRRAMMLLSIPAILGWMLIATTSEHEDWFFYQVYAGRILTGVGAGMASTPATVYVSEVADRSLRGVLVTWASIGISLGILLVYILGAILQENWRMVAGISGCFPVLSIIGIYLMVPESPVWLVSRGYIQEAELVIKKIRGISPDNSLPDDLQNEIEAMTQNNNDNKHHNWKDMVKIIKKPEGYKPLLIMNAFFFFQQWSGCFVVVFYAVSIAKDTGVNFDGYVASVLLGLTRLGVSIAISYASKRCGRRILANISGVGMTASITVLAAFLTFLEDGSLSEESSGRFSWIPITALIMFILTSSIGFLTLPWAMIGEVYPYEIRGPACGFTTCMAYIFSFVIVKMYPQMKEAMGGHGVFTFYAVVSVIGTAMMYKYLPETHGRTLEQIEQSFRKKRSHEEQKAAAETLLMENT